MFIQYTSDQVLARFMFWNRALALSLLQQKRLQMNEVLTCHVDNPPLTLSVECHARRSGNQMKYETLHWCIFNILARLFGCMALFAAFAFGLTAALQLAGASLATPEMSPLGNVVVTVFCLVLAILFLTISPYRPDLDRQDKRQSKSGWWTGMPK